MLCLTRRLNERICIGNNITLVVVEVRGDRVRLGFEAPSDVEIDREEVRRNKIRHGRKPVNLFQGMTPAIPPFAMG